MPSITHFLYSYDFGDGWEHEVQIEGIGAAQEDEPSLLCLAGANACPPEDVGGDSRVRGVCARGVRPATQAASRRFAVVRRCLRPPAGVPNEPQRLEGSEILPNHPGRLTDTEGRCTPESLIQRDTRELARPEFIATTLGFVDPGPA